MNNSSQVVKKDSLVQTRATLKWEDQGIIHRDSHYIPKLNIWCDQLPRGLEQKLMDSRIGDCISLKFPAEILIPSHESHKMFTLKRSQYLPKSGYQDEEPQPGRFYPMGNLRGISGIFRSDVRPFLVRELDKESIKIDCNHPLARKALKLELRIEAIESIFQERGGECIDLASHLSNGGSGMHTGQVKFGTESYIEQPYYREDENNDSGFYKTERLQSHLDEVARNEIAKLYHMLLQPG